MNRKKAKVNIAKYAVLTVLATGLGLWVWQIAGFRNTGVTTGVTVAVVIPNLSPLAAEGKKAFDSVCKACHGANAAGTNKGPPLVHDIYNPGHHADGAFFMAARLGARRHHWPYGDMPPQPTVSQDQVMAIVRYVRELQQANGIETRPHEM